MTDAERVLQVLIHDVRTPVGVAQGYLRLLQEQRLATPEERERAMARAIDALGRIARLCDEASAFAHESPDQRSETAVASVITGLVDARVRVRGFLIDAGAIQPQARVRVNGGAERLADAIDTVLATVLQGPNGPTPSLSMHTELSELRFSAAPQDGRQDLAALAVPFDPWKVPGLTIPLACRTINRAGGRVVRIEPGLVVTLPLETSLT